MINRITSLPEYLEKYQESITNPEDFWADIAKENFWRKKWDKILEWRFDGPDAPQVKWFEGGKLNITENIFERNMFQRKNQVAIIWEPNDPKEKEVRLTYGELFDKVKQFANSLKKLGIEKGDRVAIYLPMIPELAIAMLACARIGAVHSIVFAGFSATALADRINDSSCKIVITSDGAYRGTKSIPLKAIVDESLENCPSVKNAIVFKRTGEDISFIEGRDIWWHDLIEGVSSFNDAEVMDSEDTLFILYTSGSTGKPKGVLHTTAGYMIFSEYTFKNVFQYNNGDIYWCTADIGWVTGHSYIVYGPLLTGATSIMFEGVPTWPDAGRFWEIVDKYKVNQFYTAPTAIRALIAQGNEWVTKHNLSSLTVLGTVGEPINEEAWTWYHDIVGGGRCPIVDTWWQTETGGIMISPLAGITPTKPSFATLPLPGIQPILVSPEGEELKGNGVEGILCIKYPWPGMLRTTYGDHKRCFETYFSAFKGLYLTGDGAKRDEDGYYRIIGRIDDVINVSGHRIGTAEVEDAINQHPKVNESAVVAYPHEIKGSGIYAYVICDKLSESETESIEDEIRSTVVKHIGSIAKPDQIQVVPGLPKTRSGKIMRRILRKIGEGDATNLGDTSTLLDPGVVEEIIAGAKVDVKR
ncbi:MAG: acetate--CoA ligase [Lentimicrobiaceae bacterium]|jgi:acetyl-CoA synthetase|nr:acetate--CoA ligase [Lentimicrobiaceae bacterium]MCP4910618.1 acetate--CoA ligase [Bacteroidota bacterium]MBT3454851.1 acetate--CoA ligase [Lentimicrobiaceae bacterium]MBT4190563.1 acetate--CoA ligase [Lentimicrobiaceae bacterium]MBT4468105.1 acetate--CoA ligase [Lentimicrobiaceae bacterium]